MPTPDQRRERFIATYGTCTRCGAPRDTRTVEHDRIGDLVQLEYRLVCTDNDTHDQD